MASPWSRDQCVEEEDEEYDPPPNNGDEAEASAQNKEVVQAGGKRKRGRSKEVPEPSGERVAVPKPPKSKVWLDFTKLSKEGAEQTVAECNICKKILRAASVNGTSHLLRHLKNVHPHNQNQVNNLFLKSEKLDDGTYGVRNYKFDIESVRAGVSLFLLGGSHAFSVVEEPGYKTMMGRACPQFKNVSRSPLGGMP